MAKPIWLGRNEMESKQERRKKSENQTFLTSFIPHSSLPIPCFKIRNAERIIMSFSNGEADLAWT
jgi:hypothetical protein